MRVLLLFIHNPIRLQFTPFHLSLSNQEMSFLETGCEDATATFSSSIRALAPSTAEICRSFAAINKTAMGDGMKGMKE
jgi:hypothetical protein